jgi:hypothetical protein
MGGGEAEMRQLFGLRLTGERMIIFVYRRNRKRFDFLMIAQNSCFICLKKHQKLA